VRVSLALSLWLAPAEAPRSSVPPPRLSPSFVGSAAAAHPRSQASGLGLTPRSDGGYDYRGTAGERFDATIRPDGVVVFDVDPRVQVRFDRACLVAICVNRAGPSVPTSTVGRAALGVAAVALTEVIAGMASAASHNPVDELQESARRKEAMGTQPRQLSPNFGSVSGSFGYLPEPRSAMGDFLERTFALRLEMARYVYFRRLAEQEARLPQRLLDAWTTPGRRLAQRKADLVEIWRELEQEPPPQRDTQLQASLRTDVDPARQRAAVRARATIDAFVQRHLPLGSEAAFTPEELEAIAMQQHSGPVFSPYREGSSDESTSASQ